MKYMGSKRWMLTNGLGTLIRQQALGANRIIDPFCGSAAVAWYAAEYTRKPVMASDLQDYATSLARAVITRTEPVEVEGLATTWFAQAQDVLAEWQEANVELAKARHERQENIDAYVKEARTLCATYDDYGPVWRAYGGYYYSPSQALLFDALRLALPTEDPLRSVALAALISSASVCAAAPGHTAQPFRPTETAGKYILEAWQRDPLYHCRKALEEICPRYAHMAGTAHTGDALALAAQTQQGDLVILDPPYSGVHYSRFYHVLETIARGDCGPVEGAGRYPSQEERPRSSFSMRGQSQQALTDLLAQLSENQATVILTFPAGESSNGLTGEQVVEIASQHFRIEEKKIKGKFSTLGGNTKHRPARQESNELLLLLVPE